MISYPRRTPFFVFILYWLSQIRSELPSIHLGFTILHQLKNICRLFVLRESRPPSVFINSTLYYSTWKPRIHHSIRSYTIKRRILWIDTLPTQKKMLCGQLYPMWGRWEREKRSAKRAQVWDPSTRFSFAANPASCNQFFGKHSRLLSLAFRHIFWLPL